MIDTKIILQNKKQKQFNDEIKLINTYFIDCSDLGGAGIWRCMKIEVIFGGTKFENC